MKEKFIFYFPVEEKGGVHTFIQRFIEEANRLGNYECIVIDEKKGTVYELLDIKNFKYIKILNGDNCWKEIKEKFKIEEYTLIFMSGGNFYEIFNDIKRDIPKLKVLFYLVHPETLLNFYIGTMVNKLSLNYFKLKKFYINIVYSKLTRLLIGEIDKFNKSKSIIFMDEENIEYNERLFNYKFTNPAIIPVPITNIGKNEFELNENKNFLWLGRLEKSKCNVLKCILRDYKKFIDSNPRVKSNFIIIGDGNGRKDIELLIEKLSLDKNVELKGSIFGEELKFLLWNSNILFAMGISALEGARIGIPTILVDWYKYTPNDINYRWLFETTNYTLGRVIEKGTKIKINRSFGDIINDLNKKPLEISRKTYEYSKNHEIKKVYIEFCEYANKTSFSIDSINCNKMLKVYDNLIPVKLYKKLNDSKKNTKSI